MLQLGRLGAGHLPILFGIFFFLNLGLTYVFAVRYNHVDPVFPYISAAGDHQPESCFFSLLLNICAVLSVTIILLRRSLVHALLRDSDAVLSFWNDISTFFGILGAVAMAAVASFQETALISVHLSAACTCFGSGCVYMLVQAIITMRMHPLYANRTIGYLRLVLGILSLFCLLASIGFGVTAAKIYHSYYPSMPTPRPWSRKLWQPGYEFHVVSAILEWLMAIFHISYIMSFSRDFEKLKVTVVCESLVQHLDHSPRWGSTESLP